MLPISPFAFRRSVDETILIRNGVEVRSMAFYVVARFKTKGAWFELSEQERADWRSKMAEIREDLGIKVLQRFRSLNHTGGVNVEEVPNIEAWEKFLRRESDELKGRRYFELEFELCVQSAP